MMLLVNNHFWKKIQFHFSFFDRYNTHSLLFLVKQTKGSCCHSDIKWLVKVSIGEYDLNIYSA